VVHHTASKDYSGEVWPADQFRVSVGRTKEEAIWLAGLLHDALAASDHSSGRGNEL